VCYGCVDSGLITQKVFDAIEAFVEQWPDADYGPAHTVIADNNVARGHIMSVLDDWDKYAGDAQERIERAEEYAATKVFLRALLTWPSADRLGPNPDEMSVEQEQEK
jgi:hypothetical protein